MEHKEYVTKGRNNILNYLKANQDRAVTVKEIILYLESIDSKIDPSTIYRYLDKLYLNNLIKKYSSSDGKKSKFQYAQNDNCSNHFHLQCLECGKTIHLDCSYMKGITDHIIKHHDFSVSYSSTTLFGYCSECSNKLNINSKKNKIKLKKGDI